MKMCWNIKNDIKGRLMGGGMKIFAGAVGGAGGAFLKKGSLFSGRLLPMEPFCMEPFNQGAFFLGSLFGV